MNREFPKRKTVRLENYNYNTPGRYFVTVCTLEKRKILCDIVGLDSVEGPRIFDTRYGETARRRLDEMANFYPDIRIDKYVIMPNHIHMLLNVTGITTAEPIKNDTVNSKVSRFVGTFKRFCNREFGQNIWQSRSYDHVIRGEWDYQEIWTYIDNNPAKWLQDRFYTE